MIPIEKRGNDYNHNTTEKTTLALSHVLEWANIVAVGKTEPKLRREIITLYNDLPDFLSAKNSMRAIWGAASDYSISRRFETIAPHLATLTAKLPQELSSDQLELLGFTGFITSSLNLTELHRGQRVLLYSDEFAARRKNLEDIGDEDWLTTLGFLVERNGIKKEQVLKQQVREMNLAYLKNLKGKPVEIIDIEFMYKQVARAIYPQVKNVCIFREDAVANEAGIKIIASENYLTSDYVKANTAEERKNLIQDLLALYNYHISEPFFMPEYDMAEMYVAYITIHPHLDGNGTMTRTLIDYYCHCTGIPRIDWMKMSDPSNVLGKYYIGYPTPIHHWFKSAPRLK
jgi:fido (protein-threonine AMPylation protein)